MEVLWNSSSPQYRRIFWVWKMMMMSALRCFDTDNVKQCNMVLFGQLNHLFHQPTSSPFYASLFIICELFNNHIVTNQSLQLTSPSNHCFIHFGYKTNHAYFYQHHPRTKLCTNTHQAVYLSEPSVETQSSSHQQPLPPGQEDPTFTSDWVCGARNGGLV